MVAIGQYIETKEAVQPRHIHVSTRAPLLPDDIPKPGSKKGCVHYRRMNLERLLGDKLRLPFASIVFILPKWIGGLELLSLTHTYLPE